jgi:hypothetical protein
MHFQCQNSQFMTFFFNRVTGKIVKINVISKEQVGFFHKLRNKKWQKTLAHVQKAPFYYYKP